VPFRARTRKVYEVSAVRFPASKVDTLGPVAPARTNAPPGGRRSISNDVSLSLISSQFNRIVVELSGAPLRLTGAAGGLLNWLTKPSVTPLKVVSNAVLVGRTGKFVESVVPPT